MRLAVIDRATGNIKAVVEPEAQLAPFVAEIDEAIVLVDSFPDVADVASLELVESYNFDLTNQRFVRKPQ